MDSAALTSLTPLLDGIDRWVELAPLLPVIISLELILSADNAIALASLTRRLNNKRSQSIALNFGISLSLLLRIVLILMAQYVLRLWPIKLFAGLYLIILSTTKLLENGNSNNKDMINNESEETQISLIKVIFFLAITDLAFSIDSVAAAVAISDQFLLVITGALIGVIALRFTSGLFIRWLDEFVRLENAGYIAVAFVGIKLLFVIVVPSVDIPEWIVFLFMTVLFSWGFSKKDISIKGEI